MNATECRGWAIDALCRELMRIARYPGPLEMGDRDLVRTAVYLIEDRCGTRADTPALPEPLYY